MAKEEQKVGLLKNLTFAAEARTDGNVSAPVSSGRFRYFMDVFKRRNGLLMFANIGFVVTLLPLLAVFAIMSIFGAEKLSYILSNVASPPYLMSGIGMGISASASVLDAKLQMLMVYRLMFLAAGVSMLFLSIGLAGIMPVAMKFIWNDSFVCKKDNYGNQVPRVMIEFFRGIKKYWWQMLIMGVIFMFVVAGVGNAYIYFLSKYWQGTAGAGEWILVIFVSIATVLVAMFSVFMLPMIVSYDIPFMQKVKNSILLSLQMAIQTIFVVAVLAIPFIIVASTSGFVNVIVVALLIVYGSAIYCLILSNFMQYYSEKIIVPVYQAKFAKNRQKSGKKKK